MNDPLLVKRSELRMILLTYAKNIAARMEQGVDDSSENLVMITHRMAEVARELRDLESRL